MGYRRYEYTYEVPLTLQVRFRVYWINFRDPLFFLWDGIPFTSAKTTLFSSEGNMG